MKPTPSVSLPAASSPKTDHIVEQTIRACHLTRLALQNAGKLLVTGELELLSRIKDAEQELDRIDRELDDEVPHALHETELAQVHLLLACMKFVLDLERTGDLLSGFCARAASIYKDIRPEDLANLAQMVSEVDQMLAGALDAFRTRDLNGAMAVLRRDSEVDRLRNLLLLRHLESTELSSRNAMHIVIMAQAMERAGDHVKNLAEEVCHLVSGSTIRHAFREKDRNYEQLFIEWLKKKHTAS